MEIKLANHFPPAGSLRAAFGLEKDALTADDLWDYVRSRDEAAHEASPRGIDAPAPGPRAIPRPRRTAANASAPPGAGTPPPGGGSAPPGGAGPAAASAVQDIKTEPIRPAQVDRKWWQLKKLFQDVTEKEQAEHLAKVMPTKDNAALAGLEALTPKQKSLVARDWTFGESALRQAKEKGGKAALVLGAGALGWSAMKAHKKFQEHRKFQESKARMLELHPSLRQENPAEVEARFKTLSHVSPTIAKDPFAAGSIIKQWIEYPVVSAATLQDVSKVEANIGQGKGQNPLAAALAAFGGGS